MLEAVRRLIGRPVTLRGCGAVRRRFAAVANTVFALKIRYHSSRTGVTCEYGDSMSFDGEKLSIVWYGMVWYDMVSWYGMYGMIMVW